MARRGALIAAALGVALSVLAQPHAALAPGGQPPEPMATVPPYALPWLEGAQVKAEIGAGAPSGPSTSYWGDQPAMVNFSVWWWDTGPATTARLVLDGVAFAMGEAPSGDQDDTNGTLYHVKVNAAGLALGDHTWHFDFQGPSGSARLPAAGDYGSLRLDVADAFISPSVNNTARQIVNLKQAGQLPTLREVVNRTATMVNSSMGTDWDPLAGYNYTDPNRHIIQPVGATYDNKEVYVQPSGATRGRYTDTATHSQNSQPAIKQALVLRATLLATGLVNASDVEVWMEQVMVNGSTYGHPFLRIALPDLSEQPGDGPLDGDNSMDADVWAYGLASPVPVGSHFGEDFNGTNDAAFDGRTGWPQVVDTYSRYVLSLYVGSFNVTGPDGVSTTFYEFVSSPSAQFANPLAFSTSWTDEPVVFDGLASTQSAGVDLSFEWVIESTVWSGLGPVWLQPIQGVGLYTATLTVRDSLGQVDSVTLRFWVHGKTQVRMPIPDQTFDEYQGRTLNLMAYFFDDDGFPTIGFAFDTTPSSAVSVLRVPATNPNITVTAVANWCGAGSVTVSASDSSSPPVEVTFNVTVNCVNDEPVITNVPSRLNMTEDLPFVLGGMGGRAQDVDNASLAWTFAPGLWVTGSYDAANDSFVFVPPADRNLNDQGTLCVSDGANTVCQDVSFTVFPVNDAPVEHTPVGVLEVAEDGPEEAILMADHFRDPDGDMLSVSVTAGPGLAASYSDELRQIRFHPLANYSGATSLAVTMCDPSAACLNTTVLVTVAPVNDAPTIVTVVPSGYASASEGEVITFRVSAVDSDSPTLTYAFALDGAPQGESFVGQFEWQTSYQSAGRHDLDVTITDGAGGQQMYRWGVQVADRNRPPGGTIISPGGSTFKTGEVIALAADMTDPDGDLLNYTWTFGGALQPLYGANVSIRAHAEGTLAVKLVVSDGVDTGSATLNLTIVYERPVEPPKNNTTPTTTTTPGFLPAAGAAAALGAMAAAAGLVVLRARARRR